MQSQSKSKLAICEWPILIGFIIDLLLILRDLLPEVLRIPVILVFFIFNGKIFCCFLWQKNSDNAQGVMLFGTALAISAVALLLIAVQELVQIL